MDNMLGNMINQLGISPDQLENMEDEINQFLGGGENLPSANDDLEDGGAPAIDIPQLFKDAGFPMPSGAGEGGVMPSNPKKAKDKGEPQKKKYKFLDTYCRNLTRRAAAGKLDRIVGRERELERIIQILCRRQKNNPCLIGEPGVGKTAVVEGLAQRIADGTVPETLCEKSIVTLDIPSMIAGAKYRLRHT